MGIDTPGHNENVDQKDGPDRLVFSRADKNDKPGQRPTRPVEDVESAESLDRLDREIDNIDDRQSIDDFNSLIITPENGKYQIETDVSGEKYSLTIEAVYQNGVKVEKYNRLEEKLLHGDINLSSVYVRFDVEKIEGRPETLNLAYAVRARDLVSGTTNIDEKIKQTFAGTSDHYQKIYAGKEKEMTEQEKKSAQESAQPKIDSITEKLLERNYEVSQVTFPGGATGIIASLPGRDTQIAISTINGVMWNITSNSNKVEGQSPNEFIDNLL